MVEVCGGYVAVRPAWSRKKNEGTAFSTMQATSADSSDVTAAGNLQGQRTFFRPRRREQSKLLEFATELFDMHVCRGDHVLVEQPGSSKLYDQGKMHEIRSKRASGIVEGLGDVCAYEKKDSQGRYVRRPAGGGRHADVPSRPRARDDPGQRNEGEASVHRCPRRYCLGDASGHHTRRPLRVFCRGS